MPAGLNDGDDDTTYTAGTGLTLAGTQFSLRAIYRLPQGCSGGQIASEQRRLGVRRRRRGHRGGGVTSRPYRGTGLSGGGRVGM